ncbi:MAG: outer membrane lipoprotein carrier protein LolA [Bacteroidia bacterium]
MKNALILLFVQFISLASYAQVDKKAKEILDNLSAKTKSYSSISSEFNYTLENKDRNINTTQKWKLALKGDKYRLEMGQQVVISDGKTMWKVLKMDEEVEISTPSNDEDAINPKSIFTMYEKGFKYKYIKEQKLGTKSVHVIDLYPLNPKEKDFVSIRLYIDKSGPQVVRSEIKGKNGNVYTYEITKFETNKTLADNFFSFNNTEFPGFDVNDLR